MSQFRKYQLIIQSFSCSLVKLSINIKKWFKIWSFPKFVLSKIPKKISNPIQIPIVFNVKFHGLSSSPILSHSSKLSPLTIPIQLYPYPHPTSILSHPHSQPSKHNPIHLLPFPPIFPLPTPAQFPPQLSNLKSLLSFLFSKIPSYFHFFV